MSTWRDKAKKLLDAPSRELPKPTEPPFVSFGSESDDTKQEIFETYGTGRDAHGYQLAPLVSCGECSHFTRNTMNPEAGIGCCDLGEPDGYRQLPHYPGASRCCSEFTPTEAML